MAWIREMGRILAWISATWKPARSARRAPCVKAVMMASIPAVSSSVGTMQPASKGMALGATSGHPPSDSLKVTERFSQGGGVLALRPAWASCMPGMEPCLLTNPVMRLNA